MLKVLRSRSDRTGGWFEEERTMAVPELWEPTPDEVDELVAELLPMMAEASRRESDKLAGRDPYARPA